MMDKIVIIDNALERNYARERLSRLYDDKKCEFYFVRLEKGFTARIPSDATEILFGGGSAKSLRHEPDLKTEIFSFVTETKLPILGICFGAQIIARAFGSHIVQLPYQVEGLEQIRIIADKSSFNNYYIQSVYKRQIWSLQDMPQELKIIACSANGVEIFMHTSRKIAGVQFHPEVFQGTNDGVTLFRLLRSQLINR